MKLLMESWRSFLTEEVETEEQAAQWLAKNIAPLIQQADAGNFTQPLALLVQRLNTPDGASDAVRTLLRRGAADDDPTDEAIKVRMGVEIPAPRLVPTQGVIDLFKSVGYNGSNARSLQSVIDGVSGAPPILAAGDGGTYYIIDGHHRWSGATVFNTNCKIPANVIVMDPGKALLVSQLAIAAYKGGGQSLPSASAKQGRSIIGSNAMSAEQVNKLLLANVGKVMDKNAGGAFMNEQVQAVVKQSNYGGGDVEGACAQISSNCGALASKYGSEGPPREIMPQFDPDKGGPKFKQVAKDFSGGNINYKPEFKT